VLSEITLGRAGTRGLKNLITQPAQQGPNWRENVLRSQGRNSPQTSKKKVEGRNVGAHEDFRRLGEKRSERDRPDADSRGRPNGQAIVKKTLQRHGRKVRRREKKGSGIIQ